MASIFRGPKGASEDRHVIETLNPGALFLLEGSELYNTISIFNVNFYGQISYAVIFSPSYRILFASLYLKQKPKKAKKGRKLKYYTENQRVQSRVDQYRHCSRIVNHIKCTVMCEDKDFQ